MIQYTIYCTPEQTKKALGLGAPIITFGYGDLGNAEDEILKMNRQAVLSRKDDNSIIVGQIPTTEQMLSWLEENDIFCIRIYRLGKYTWDFSIYNSEMQECHDGYNFPTRKEATIAAIDAALEYLSNNRE